MAFCARFVRATGALSEAGISARLATMSYSSLALRDYQHECVDRCLDSINQGQRRIGVSLATGGGKTVIFSSLIDRLRRESGKSNHKTLILVHRRELAQQACRVLRAFFPTLNFQMEMGNYKCDLESTDVVVASVQSLVRRLERYDPSSIDLIIIDEAHHAAAKSYLRILEHFKADHKDSALPVVGFSATFERADNKALSTVIDEIVYHRGILEMIDDKWLCEGRFTTVSVSLDLSGVAVTGSDFNIGGLSKVVNTKEVNKVVLQTYFKKMDEHKLKSTLLFGCDIKHIETLHALFVKHGVNAQYVTGKTRQSERDAVVEDFKHGKIEVLMNCGVFTEGTDIPNVDSILLCRPTKSRSLLVQMIGRGLRVHHSKEHCHIVDFVGASSVGVVSFPTLAGVEGVNTDLDEATLQELRAIKDDITAKQLEAEKKVLAEKEMESLLIRQFRDLMKSASAFDLTLTTYKDFKSFHQQTAANNGAQELDWGSEKGKEIKLLRDSSYPWVQFSKDAWGMPLDAGYHLRIYKERPESSKPSTYALKLYRQLPYKLRSEFDIRHKPLTVKNSPDLSIIVASIEGMIQELTQGPSARPKNFTKYAPWRQTPATEKQTALLRKKILGYISKQGSKSEQLQPEDVDKFLNGMTKGDVSSVLFATTMAPVYPIKSLCKIISYRSKS
ncbi:LAQU0S10e02234g1_1 [Lachancea quebecensis]|uniref:LAQU0S10e02234g1_1 n=1 Tax=Lachancea quebecensis TaxID=1654605 RepID=A0A0N7MLX6_9SACH|nr:LAQU0S10e02234g1_1 [Lachancea quebecensis]